MDGKRCRKIFKKILTTSGLVLFCVGYVLLGAIVFNFIEGKNEKNVKDFAMLTLIHGEAKALNMTHRFWQNHSQTALTEEKEKEYQAELRTIVKELIKDYIKSIKDEDWDGESTTAEGSTNAWRFANCALFTATIVTTIGYGHITPKTQAGRLVTMFYAIIGIPITVLTLARMGHLFGRAFRYGYFYTTKLMRFLLGLCIGKKKKKMSSGEPENDVEDTEKKNTKDMTEKEKQTRREQFTETVKAQRIPITLCLMIIAGYILFGAMAFRNAQSDWTFTEACYFCFITISTIGFGDYVYGNDPVVYTSEETFIDKLQKNSKLIWTCMYILFGMVLNSMCIDLMAREVIRQAYLIAVKLRRLFGKKKRRKKMAA